MSEVKFLHCADLHLDMPFTSLGAENGTSVIRRQDLKETFQSIIELAKKEKVDVLLISGDLYEHHYVKKSTINYINDRFAAIPEIKVIIVPGNHDPYISNSYYSNFIWSSNVHILTDQRPHIYLEELNTNIYGAGFSNFYEEKSLIEGLERAKGQYINILLTHGTLDMSFDQSSYNPMDSKALEYLGMDYVALGHFHNRIDDAAKIGTVYNPGSPEPLGFDEAGQHGVYLGTIKQDEQNNKSLEVSFIKLNKRFYENIEVNIDGCNNDEQIMERILEAIGNKDSTNGLFNITLKGYTECEFKVNVAQIQQWLKDTLFFIKIKDETCPDYNFDEIKKEPGLRGLFTRRMLELADKAEHHHEKELLMKALYYGMEALEQGSVDVGV